MKICGLVPMEMTGFRFHIKPKNIPAALDAAKRLHDEYKDRNLPGIFSYLGFSAEADKYGIDELSFCYDINVETIEIINFLNAIAPFVQAGSYIEMMGTEGGVWRWVFNGQKVFGQFPFDYLWPSPPLEENQFLGFTHSSRQTHWKTTKQYSDCADEVIFGIHDERGGVIVELPVRWHLIDDHAAPRIEWFFDDFHEDDVSLLTQVVTSAKRLGDQFSPEDFCRMLIRLGFKDLSDKTLD